MALPCLKCKTPHVEKADYIERKDGKVWHTKISGCETCGERNEFRTNITGEEERIHVIKSCKCIG